MKNDIVIALTAISIIAVLIFTIFFLALDSTDARTVTEADRAWAASAPLRAALRRAAESQRRLSALPPAVKALAQPRGRATLADVRRDWGISGRLACRVVSP